MGSPRNWRPAFEQQTARINVDDNTWREFRARCLADDEHVSEVLARLVRAELDRTVSTRERVNTKASSARRRAARANDENVDRVEELSLLDL